MSGLAELFQMAARWYFFAQSPDGEVVVMVDTFSGDPWYFVDMERLKENCFRRHAEPATVRVVRYNALDAKEQAVVDGYWRHVKREERKTQL